MQGVIKLLKVIALIVPATAGFNVKGLANTLGMAKNKSVSVSEGDRPMWAQRRVIGLALNVLAGIVWLATGAEVPQENIAELANNLNTAVPSALAVWGQLLIVWGQIKKEKLIVLLCLGFLLTSCLGHIKSNVREGCAVTEELALGVTHIAPQAHAAGAITDEDYEKARDAYNQAKDVVEHICHKVKAEHGTDLPEWDE